MGSNREACPSRRPFGCAPPPESALLCSSVLKAWNGYGRPIVASTAGFHTLLRKSRILVAGGLCKQHVRAAMGALKHLTSVSPCTFSVECFTLSRCQLTTWHDVSRIMIRAEGRGCHQAHRRSSLPILCCGCSGQRE